MRILFIVLLLISGMLVRNKFKIVETEHTYIVHEQ